MKPFRDFLLEQRPKIDSTSRKPSLDVESARITMLHGTTNIFAKSIRANGFQPGNPEKVAHWIEDAYDLPRGSVFQHPAFEFARGRRDLDRVHMTADPSIAVQYTIPEVIQDALKAVWSLKQISQSDRMDWKNLQTWINQEGRRLVKPEILAVNMPFDVIGQHAFGKKLTLQDFLKIGLDMSDLHSISVPMGALYDYNISPYR